MGQLKSKIINACSSKNKDCLKCIPEILGSQLQPIFMVDHMIGRTFISAVVISVVNSANVKNILFILCDDKIHDWFILKNVFLNSGMLVLKFKRHEIYRIDFFLEK